ncbi:ABC-type multidrug transport system fused ATPase/permease subunit [Fontibacillus solani]|uniref:ABC-type multidrug transport system fused ATPase/permease subunit n=1 Tax=Fontibacillus solani TaxID=1572857 RepID=A0A7W3XPQ8_9BACL|nr:hypothetical protein [Fontibacillus solani]MBA9083586.1 ABC-type multidrug transport system fused ATPase/permease subunit [Fontibacillus solani]
MNKKKTIILHPPLRTKYAYEKLKCCKYCQSYTVLNEEKCTVCGKSGLRPVLEKARHKAKRTQYNDLLLTLFLTLLAILFSQTFQLMAISAGAGVLLLGLLYFVQRQALDSRISIELSKLFQRERGQITAGLIRNLETAAALEEEGRSYEMMREVAVIVHNDHIRKLQIMLLQSFVLRKDMELELEPLLLDDFDPELAAYIGELAKIKRELIKDKTFQYVIKYEQQILAMENGKDILAGVAGATIRLKRYVLAYSGFIARYARRLSKDRFLRLYRMLAESPGLDWGELSAETARVYEEKYQWDADFQQIKPRSTII